MTTAIVLAVVGGLLAFASFWVGYRLASTSRRHRHDWSPWSTWTDRWGDVHKQRVCQFPKCSDAQDRRISK